MTETGWRRIAWFLGFNDPVQNHINLTQLCQKVEGSWPERLSKEGWYLVVVSSSDEEITHMLSTLIACGKPQATKEIYHYLCNTSHGETASREKLSARIKDCLMKEWTLVGIPLVVTAASALAAAEAELDMVVAPKDWQHTASRYEKLELTRETEEQGLGFMRMLYQDNLEPIMRTWGSHGADFEWLTKRIIYGLFLSDHTVLDVYETEFVNVSAIMCQGLNGPTMWHLRGLRRLGVSVEEAERVCDAVKLVAQWAGKDTNGWLRAEDVEI